MHTELAINSARWFGPCCGPVENYRLGARLNHAYIIRRRRGLLSRDTRREHTSLRRAGKGIGYIMPLICWFALLAAPVAAFPVRGSQTVLPAGTELNEDALDRPREVFRSEAIGGRKSYLINFGDVAFSSPAILGGAARRGGMSCSIATSMALPIPNSTFRACRRGRAISSPPALCSMPSPTTGCSTR
jgi:hypothetical protein